MVRVKLSGLHFTHKRLADGTRRTYWYAWPGGPRLPGEPGSPEFLAAVADAEKQRRESLKRDNLAGLADAFQDSPDFPTHPGTAADYRRHLLAAGRLFGQMSYGEIETRGSRALFLEWRDEIARERGARTADYVMTVLARCLSWAAHREIIARNPLERIGRLHRATRAESVWTLDEEAALHAAASPSVSLACHIAQWTGQRQADILRMTWSAYDGRSLLVRQSKGGAAVRIPVAAPLKRLLDATKRRSPFIVTTTRSRRGSSGDVHGPYTSDGFRASFAAICDRAEIAGRTFHDFRGTFATRAQESGATQAEVSAVTGHGQGGNVLAVSYTSYTYQMAEACIAKLAQWHEARTNHQTVHQTGATSAGSE
jgi:integrase